MLTNRSELRTAKRVVVKVGSSSISGENAGQLGALVAALAQVHQRGTQVILVSSGAIATGLPLLGMIVIEMLEEVAHRCLVWSCFEVRHAVGI